MFISLWKVPLVLNNCLIPDIEYISCKGLLSFWSILCHFPINYIPLMSNANCVYLLSYLLNNFFAHIQYSVFTKSRNSFPIHLSVLLLYIVFLEAGCSILNIGRMK
jgi:hypothetical protein